MNYEDDRKSQFNAGVAMAKRIDDLQQKLNAARFNPLMLNASTGTYNYEVMIKCCDGLISEAIGKMNDVEKTVVAKIQEIIGMYQKCYLVIKKTKDGDKINLINFEKLFPLINYYEVYAKTVLDNHNFNSPDFDNDDGI